MDYNHLEHVPYQNMNEIQKIKKQANKHFYHLQYTTVLEKKFPEGSFFHFFTGKHSWIQCKLTKVFFLAILSVLFMSWNGGQRVPSNGGFISAIESVLERKKNIDYYK